MRNDSQGEEGALNLGTSSIVVGDSFPTMLICSLVEEFIESL